MEKRIKRDPTIDILKGLCIILVVLGHCRFPFNNFIYLFHVPVFFMASGYFWNDKNCQDKKSILNYIIKKVKTLWLPFVIAQCSFILLNNVFVYLNIYTNNEQFLNFALGENNVLHHYMGIGETGKELLKSIFFVSSTQLGGALWFLRVLFFVTIGHMLLCAIIKKIGHSKVMFTIVVVLCLICTQLIDVFHDKIIKGIQPFFASYLAYLLGIAIKNFSINEKLKKYRFAVLIVSFASLLGMNFFVHIEVNKGIISNVLFYVLTSILGWYLLWSLSALIKGPVSAALQYIGKNTMCIVILHFISFKIVSYIYIVITGGNMLLLASFPVLDNVKYLWIPYTIVGVAVPLLLNYPYQKAKKLILLKQGAGKEK